LALVGAVVVEWGELEHLLHQTCWDCSDAEQFAHTTGSGRWEDNWSVIHQQVRLCFAPLQAAADDIAPQLARAAARVQRLTHGIWVPGDPAGMRLQQQLGRVRIGGQEESDAALRVTRLSIIVVRNALAALHVSILAGGDPGGGAGVREPRRPYPQDGSGGIAAPLP
jgi:hypothetical protein